MADEAYPTSKPGQRQLSSMTEEEKARYDAASAARREEAAKEPIESVKSRYGLESKPAPTYSEEAEGIILPVTQLERAIAPKTVPETEETRAMSQELAERYKQFHSAPPSLKSYFAGEIKSLEAKIGSPRGQIVSAMSAPERALTQK